MKKVLFCGLILLFSHQIFAQAVFSTSQFKVALDNKGNLTSLFDKVHQREYLHPDTLSTFLSVKTIDGTWQRPTTMRWDRRQKVLSFRYAPSGISAAVKVTEKTTHIVFELVQAEPMAKIDRVMWGSIPTTISKIVGEIIGVVRDNDFAIGLQVLNLKTIGGYSWNDEGFDPSRSSVAIPKRWGSILQAYSINRARARNADVWNGAFKNMPIEPLPNETVVGSKIALFGVPEKDGLDTIGAIELAEGLPHPMYKGVWIKKSPEMGRSYIISDFNEEQVDEMIAHTKRADLMSLYHEGPFKAWGHYELSPNYFPNGKEGVKRAAAKAHAAGIHFGVHTLTNFTSTSDAYVSPIPDERLVKRGSSTLTEAISATATEIAVASPEYFDYEKDNWLHLVKIGKELIRYRSVSKSAPFRLLDCQRGAFGTSAAAHDKGSEAAKLFDHGYEVVFPNIPMQNEIAKNLALLFNETDIDHLDFDGHEGGMASGQGDYGIEAFSKVFYDNADHFVVNGTSNSKPFYWHINTYCNWGEPWYGGFKESMQEYRINNQGLFERNYMPNMLGWYLMTATTSLSEMEWMLARAAGYKAGFAMVLRVQDARKNPIRDTLLDALREWEHARRAGAFTDEQRARLKNPANEFHLEKVAENEWRLFPFHVSAAFSHQKRILQPGEPTYSSWNFTNPDGEQPLQFRMEALGSEGQSGEIANPVLIVDNYAEVRLPVSLQAGESLVVDGTTLVRIYDAKGRQRATYELPSALPKLTNGEHRIKADATFNGDTPLSMQLRFKTMGTAESVKK